MMHHARVMQHEYTMHHECNACTNASNASHDRLQHTKTYCNTLQHTAPHVTLESADYPMPLMRLPMPHLPMPHLPMHNVLMPHVGNATGMLMRQECIMLRHVPMSHVPMQQECIMLPQVMCVTGLISHVCDMTHKSCVWHDS